MPVVTLHNIPERMAAGLSFALAAQHGGDPAMYAAAVALCIGIRIQNFREAARYHKMLGKMLIKHCSPTLGGLKTASLFSFPYLSDRELEFAVSAWNMKLNPKGVSLYIMRRRKERALIYVCRYAMLTDILQDSGIQAFLMAYGYQEYNALYCIEKLSKRLQSSVDFPHEIGLFLGYPLEDVKGFIDNAGQNCKYSGYWRVYCDEHETVKLFIKYKKCKDIYTQLFENRARSVIQLTVAVHNKNTELEKSFIL